MTGEPLPKTWQEFFELTPEQKAQWDAELKLDAEYRIAEAQGFPNGIPGGKERGSIFYFLAQREKEYKRECEEVQEEYAKDQEKHFSLRQKTDILGKNKWVMEYDPYGTSPKHEPMEPLILPKEDFLMEKIELKYDTDALNNVIRNAAAKSTPNVNSDASWWQAMNQPTYNFSRNIYDDYRQNDGETNVWDAWNHTANSDADDSGQVKFRKEVVVNNPTGIGVFEHMTALEPFFKPPLSPLFGHTFQDNYRLAEQMSEQYEDEITVAVEMAKSIVPPVVLEIADKAVPFLPPHLQGGARGLLITIDIGLAVYEVYDEWDAEVALYMKQHGCLREVAEENVELAKKVHDAFMIFSTHKWLQYVMRSAGYPADLKITVGVEVLELISEGKLKEWGKMLTE